MAEFNSVFLYSTRAVQLGYKPLSAFFCANLDRQARYGLRFGAVCITLDHY